MALNNPFELKSPQIVEHQDNIFFAESAYVDALDEIHSILQDGEGIDPVVHARLRDAFGTLVSVSANVVAPSQTILSERDVDWALEKSCEMLGVTYTPEIKQTMIQENFLNVSEILHNTMEVLLNNPVLQEYRETVEVSVMSQVQDRVMEFAEWHGLKGAQQSMDFDL